MVAPAEPFPVKEQYKRAWNLRKAHDASEEVPEVEPAARQAGASAVLEDKATGAVLEAVEDKTVVAAKVLSSEAVEAEGENAKILGQKNVVGKFGEYEPEKYKAARYEFIHERQASGSTWKVAALAWDLSDLKRKLLKDVSLPELKRRRFVTKEATVNPWSSECQ